MEGLCPSRPPSPSASHACCSILFSSSFPAPLSWGHFLMPFLNLAPIPPKSNQIHNLIRQKNEENVRLPASPLTGRRAAANLENVTARVTTGWGWGRGRAAIFRSCPLLAVGCRQDPEGGPPGLCFPNRAVDTLLAQKKCMESNSLSQLHLQLWDLHARRTQSTNTKVRRGSTLGDISPPSWMGLCKSKHFCL